MTAAPGDGWWQASDMEWYPPEVTPDWEALGPDGERLHLRERLHHMVALLRLQRLQHVDGTHVTNDDGDRAAEPLEPSFNWLTMSEAEPIFDLANLVSFEVSERVLASAGSKRN